MQTIPQLQFSVLLKRCVLFLVVAETGFWSNEKRSTLVSLSPYTGTLVQSNHFHKYYISLYPFNMNTYSFSVNVFLFTDDSFNTRNLSRTISSSISTPCIRQLV